MKEFAIVLLLFSFALAQWSAPVRVDDNCYTELRRASIFSDQHARVTHYFWCELSKEDRRFHLMYRRQYQNGIFSEVEILDLDHECEQVAVTGAFDGEQIFVAYAADRRSKHTHCTIDTKDGCLDIYSLNSADGGFTWSMPRQVPRSNTNDVLNRQYPSIIRSSLTGRVWIFYAVSNVGVDASSIAFVTKAGDSITYATERVLGFHPELILTVSAATTTFSGSATMIHVAWTGEVNKQIRLTHIASTTNGDSWTNYQVPGNGFLGQFTSEVRMDPTYLAMTYLQTAQSPSQVAVSTNAGKDWRLISISSYPGIADASICFKYSKNDALLFTFVNAGSGNGQFKGEFGYIRLSDGQWIRGTNPFGEMNLAYSPTIRCYTENNQFVIKVVAVEASEYGQNSKIYTSKMTLG